MLRWRPCIKQRSLCRPFAFNIFFFFFEWKIREIWENFGVEGNFVHDREINRKQERLPAHEVSWVRSRQ
jgi:hypothetical protein